MNFINLHFYGDEDGALTILNRTAFSVGKEATYPRRVKLYTRDRIVNDNSPRERGPSTVPLL